MKSMTGFGNHHGSSKGVDLDINSKAVNGRYLDLKFILPSEYAPYENEMKTLATKFFGRGTIQILVSRKVGPEARKTRVTVRADRAQQWIEGYQELGKKLRLLAEPNLDMIARIPEVLLVEDLQEVTPQEKSFLFETLEESLRKCDEERLREGLVLGKELERLLKELQSNVKTLRSLAKKNSSYVKKAFHAKLKKLGVENSNDPKWLETALPLIDKGDVQEELVRLTEHLKNCAQLLKSKQSVGKKLDFYTQELLREFNTVGSKSQMAEMTRLVIDSKSLIEQFREQIQNIE